MTKWTWAAARARGTSHARSGTPCQDAFQCRLVNETLVAIVADGAGSAELGGQGAMLGVRSMMGSAADYVRTSPDLPSDDMLWTWIDTARDHIAAAAETRGAVPRAYASTLILVIASPSETLVLHIGDGAAAMRFAEGDDWQVPLWPSHGEYASTTFFLTDEPQPQVRIERLPEPASAIVVISDGLERLALDFAGQVPHRPFFDGIVGPLLQAEGSCGHAGLSKALRSYLDSDTINQRTDDDKTLVVAVRR